MTENAALIMASRLENAALIMALLRLERARIEYHIDWWLARANAQALLSLAEVNAEIARRIPQQGLRGPLSEWGHDPPGWFPWYGIR